MVTHIRAIDQGPGKVALDQGLRLLTRTAGDHPDSLFRKEVKSPLAHATGKDKIHSQIPQPARQDPWFMRRRSKEFFVVDQSFLDPDYGKLLAMAEVIA